MNYALKLSKLYYKWKVKMREWLTVKEIKKINGFEKEIKGNVEIWQRNW